MEPSKGQVEVQHTSPARCCPRFDPEPFRDRELHWKNERFVKDQIASLFHVPVNMSTRMQRAKLLIDAAHARSLQPLTLIDETSAWSADIYLRVTKHVPGATMVQLSGTYITRVFQGPSCDAPQWAREMRRFVEARGQKLEHLYFYYPTCQACAKAYGASYVVLFARVT